MRVISTLALMAASIQSSSFAQQKSPVAVSISTPTPVVASGAEVRIDVTVLNTSNHTVQVPRVMTGSSNPESATHWDQKGQDLGGLAEAANLIVLYDAEGKTPVWIGGPQLWISRRVIDIKPGDCSADFLILSKLYDLRKPGS